MKNKKITIIIIILIIIAVIICAFLIKNKKDKWPVSELFGTVIEPGDFYEYTYGSNQDSYYIMRNTSYTTATVFEDFIDSLIQGTSDFGTFLSEKVYKMYNQTARDYGYDATMKEIIEGYDLKVVNGAKSSVNDAVKISYKLYIKDDSWCIVDSENELIALGRNQYGKAIAEIFEESAVLGLCYNNKYSTTNGMTSLEQNVNR